MDQNLTILISIFFLAFISILHIINRTKDKKSRLLKQTITHLSDEKTIAVNKISQLNTELLQKISDFKNLNDKQVILERTNAVLEQKIHNATEQEERLDLLDNENKNLTKQLIEFEVKLSNYKDKLSYWEKSAPLMKQQFENIANQIFQDNTDKFTTQSKHSVQNLLVPFRQQIEDFKKQIEHAYGEENKERRSLQNEVRDLKTLNKNIMQEAINLTQALKGDSKIQGNWGETILARILEESGLQKGREFETQVALTNHEGKRYQPDIIIRLPNRKDIIIDSKVSLVDYERYHKAQKEAEKSIILASHIKSIKKHINDLYSKDYRSLNNINTLDYVLMFIPIEPAFYIALEEDPTLFQDALDKNIMLVSPTNLLVVLKTINHIWRYERQQMNTLEISEKAGAIYDKLCGLIDDMVDIGMKIDKLQSSHDKAMKKFKTGRGNLIKQAQNFVDLGVKCKKQLPADIVDEALLNDKIVDHCTKSTNL